MQCAGNLYISNAVRLDALGAAPTTSAHLGGSTVGTLLSSSASGNILSISLTTGSWIVFGNLYFPICTSKEISISATSNNVDQSSAMLFGGSTGGSIAISRAVNVATSQTWYLVAITAPTVNIQNPTFYAYRVG